MVTVAFIVASSGSPNRCDSVKTFYAHTHTKRQAPLQDCLGKVGVMQGAAEEAKQLASHQN